MSTGNNEDLALATVSDGGSTATSSTECPEPTASTGSTITANDPKIAGREFARFLRTNHTHFGHASSHCLTLADGVAELTVKPGALNGLSLPKGPLKNKYTTSLNSYKRAYLRSHSRSINREGDETSTAVVDHADLKEDDVDDDA